MDTKNIKYPIIGTGYKTLSKIKDGNSNIVLNLTNDSHVVPSDVNGENPNLVGCSTIATLHFGNKPVISDVIYRIDYGDSIFGSWNEQLRMLTVTSLTSDSDYVDITAVYKEQEYTARFTVSKVRNGEESILIDLTNDSHWFSCSSSGSIEEEASITTEVLAFKGVTQIDITEIEIPSEDKVPIGLRIEKTGDAHIKITAEKGGQLAIAGWFDITVRAGGTSIKKTFRWIKIRDGEKGEDGAPGQPGEPGPPGPIIDWVKDWTDGATFINGQKVLAGSIFAGVGGASPSGIALGKKAISPTEDGLSVYSSGTQLINFYTNPRTVNGQANTIASFGTGSNAMTISSNGTVRIPAANISGTVYSAQVVTGNISADQITSGTLSGNRIHGGIITGTVINTSAAILNDSGIHFYDGGTQAGTLSYDYLYNPPGGDASNRLWLRSFGPYALKIQSGGNMSISANEGYNSIYIKANSTIMDGSLEVRGNINATGIVAVFG